MWEAFLRLCDAGDHDIAGSSEEIEALIQALDKLFVRGVVFEDTIWRQPLANQPAIGGQWLAPAITPNMQAANVHGEFVTGIVKKQLQRQCVSMWVVTQFCFWGGEMEKTRRSLQAESKM